MRTPWASSLPTKHPAIAARWPDAFRRMVTDLADGTTPVGARSVRGPRRRAPRGSLRAAWLRVLPHEVGAWVVGAIEIRPLAAGEVLIARDEPPRGWFGVAEGFLAAEQSPGARPWHGLGLPSAAWFGEHDLLLDAPCDATVTALVPTRVAVLPKPSFDRLLEQQPGFSRFVLQLQAQRVAALRHRLTWPPRVGTNAGVALRLAELFAAAALFDGDHHVALTQASLSSFVGLSRQRINEALNRLRRCGELELLYGGLRVLDPPRLARRALAGNFDE